MPSDQPAIAFPSSLEHNLRSCGVETKSNDTRELLGLESSKSNELSVPSGPKPTGITLYNIFHTDLNKIRKTTNQGVDIDIPYHSSSQNKRDNHSLLSTNINIWGSISSQDLSALVQLDLVIHASALSLLQQLYIDVGIDNVNIRSVFGLDLEPTCTYDMKETEEEIVVLYSMTKNLFQSYPHWGQMDEAIQSWYSRLPLLSLPDETLDTRTLVKKLWNEFYKSINIKVKLICPDASNSTEGRFHTSDVAESKMRLNEKPSMFDLLYPIHHDYLCCLPANYPSGHDDKSNLTSGVLEMSKYSSAVPNFLPSNSMLIHYSDGSTRVHCELYNMLLKKGVISDTSKEKQEGETGVSIYTKRFEDKVFDVLDEGVGYAKESADIKVSTSLDPKGNTREQMVSMDFSEAHKHGNRGESLQTKLCTDIADRKLCNPCEISSMSIHEKGKWSVHVEGDTCHKMMTDALRKEVELLRELNMVEKGNLDYDVAALARNVAEIKRLLQHVKLGETESKEIEKEISREQEIASEIDLYVEARRVKLLEGLSAIYPIQTLPDQYTIHGIHIPHDMHSLVSSDEFISSGLGYVCHFVAMSSKYLSIPVRYRMLCNSSRSAIQNDGFDVYPLFKERVVEKEQFDLAHLFLQRNIDLLLRTRKHNLTNTTKVPVHMLAKLDTLVK